jgi:hypothetical protein
MHMPCNLHDQGCFILHFAYATEVWQGRGLLTQPGIHVAGAIESVRQMVADMGFASYPKATPPNSIDYPYIAAQPWHAISREYSRQILSGPFFTMESPRGGDLFAWRFCRGSGRNVVREIYGYRYG